MRILTLDCTLELPDETSMEFRSDASLFDFDLVIWDPQNTKETFQVDSEYRGYPSLTPSDSAALRRDITRRSKEFAEFVDLGRTLVVFAPGDTRVYADTGDRQYSGTGKNRQTTRIVDMADVADAIPMDCTFNLGSGSAIEGTDPRTTALLKATSGSWAYRSVLQLGGDARAIFYVRGTKKVVGAVRESTPDGGLLLIIPDFVAPEGKEQVHHAALLEWVLSLTGGPDTSQPSWAAEFLFATEVERSAERLQVEAGIEEVRSRLERLRADQAADDQWKGLVTGTGVALERQVERALVALGFKVEERDRGRSDLRVSLGDRRAVVEIKGVGKSASEKHAAQLEKWVSEELVEGRSAKGILIVNGWREEPLDKRTEPTFPPQMQQYSQQRDHCLVSGLQLLSIVRACLADPGKKEELASLLLDAGGTLDGWDRVEDVFEITKVAERKAPLPAKPRARRQPRA